MGVEECGDDAHVVGFKPIACSEACEVSECGELANRSIGFTPSDCM